MAARGPDQVCAKQMRARAETPVLPDAVGDLPILSLYPQHLHGSRTPPPVIHDVRQRTATGNRVLPPELPQERPKFRCERSPVAQRSSIKSLSPLRKYHSHLHQDALR
jgi:hypothetical protein